MFESEEVGHFTRLYSIRLSIYSPLLACLLLEGSTYDFFGLFLRTRD
jgi:hypothetical protein